MLRIAGGKRSDMLKAKVTIADVAKSAGVSAMTVSRVLNNKGEISPATRERVQAAIDRLGYRPSAIARSLATQRSRTLGLMVPDITNPFFPEIVRGAEDAAWRSGYTMIFCNTVEDLEREAATLQRLEDNRVDGVILCSARLPDEALVPLIKRHSAVVLVNRDVPSELAGTVQIDDGYGTMRAVHHLMASGRRIVGLLAGPPYSHSGKKRLQGFLDAHETIGNVVAKSLIEPCSPDEAGGVQATKALIARHPNLDGLICYNDLVAIGALQACGELGTSVPDDIAIVGCDDIRLASLVTPALSTLRVDKYALGTQAVTLLLEQLEQHKSNQRVTLKPELVIRASAP
jgi:LacI family transcriptional regulator